MTPQDQPSESIIRSEAGLWVGAITTGLFVLLGGDWLADLSNPLKSAAFFIWLFVVIFWLAFSVVRHADQLQRTINIALGSATSTIGMTIPVILTISLITDRPLELGLEPLEIVLLTLTLLLSVVSFGAGRTNVLQGMVHLIVFASYVVLIFD